MKDIHGQYYNVTTNGGETPVLVSSGFIKYALPQVNWNQLNDSYPKVLERARNDEDTKQVKLLLDKLMEKYDVFDSVEDMLYSLELM